MGRKTEQINDINAYIQNVNNKPVDDFSGLSASEFHYLLYEPLGPNSILKLRNNIESETLDKIPLFRILEEYLKIIHRDKFIKLTPGKALPKKVIVELYNKGFFCDEFIESGLVKILRERDCISIMNMRLTAELARLVKKENGKLVLTKTTIKLIESGNRMQIFSSFLLAFTSKFAWSNNDLYPDVSIGQFGWAFTLYLLYIFGDEPSNNEFYSGKYFKALPKLMNDLHNQDSIFRNYFVACYGVRTFYRFLLWFGFVTMDKEGKYLDLDTDVIKRTDLVKSIFELKKI